MQEIDLNFDILFPPLPRTITEVVDVVSKSSEPDVPRLISIVETDPLMTDSVLRRVNSAYFGLRQRCSDVSRAVSLLGFLDVCNIVLTAALQRVDTTMTDTRQGDILNAILRRCIGIAFYTRELAQFFSLRNGSLAYTVGLLYPIGHIVLLYNFPRRYESLWFSKIPFSLPTTAEERAAFSVDSLEMTSQAVRHWNMPEEVIDIVGSFHAPGRIPDEGLRDVCLTVLAANWAVMQIEDNAGSIPPQPVALSALARRYSVSVAQVHQFITSRQEAALAYLQMMLRGS